MFSNIFGKKEEENPDQIFKERVYMTTQAKIKACIDMAKRNEELIFIAWFAETAKQFKTYFTENGISENRVTEASKLTATQLLSYIPVFIEHYPLYATEENFVSNWKRKNILVYSAMDEPLFKHLGSDKVIPMMKLLGMKENEVIEHAMVNKSISKGQQKIAEEVSADKSASSQGEWIQKNIK